MEWHECRRDIANTLNRVVDAVGERAGLPEGKAREWAYYALLQMINATQQQSIAYDEYYGHGSLPGWALEAL